MKILTKIKEALMPKNEELIEAVDDEQVDVEDTDSEQEPAKTFRPITTQEELDRIIKARLARVKPGDAALKFKADEAEARATKAEARLTEIEAERARAKHVSEVARRYDIPEDVLETIPDDRLENYAVRAAPFFQEQCVQTLPVVVTEGSYIPPVGITPPDFLREALEAR
jgi:hypothetical protein